MVYGLSLAGIAYLEEQTGSSAGTGLVILSSILPAFLGSLVAGAVVDRFGRRPTLLVSHLSRALLGLGFWASTRSLSPGAASPWALPFGASVAAISLVNVGTATFGQFAFPAELSLVPDLVHADQVPRANAFLQFGMLLGEGLGVIFLTPVLIRLWGVPAVGLSGALLCLVALLLVLGLPKEAWPSSAIPGTSEIAGASPDKRGTGARPLRPEREGDRPRLTWSDLKAGWKIIAADPLLRLVVLQATVAATLLLVLLSLLPGLATRHLGVMVADAPYLILPGGVTFVLAAAVVSRRLAPLHPTQDGVHASARGITAGLLVLGLSTALLGASAIASDPLHPGSGWGIGPALTAVTGIGLGLGAVVIPGRVVLQQRPPRELRARVIAGQLTLANAAAVIPLLVGGTVADRLGLGEVIVALGVVALLAALAGAGFLRRARPAALSPGHTHPAASTGRPSEPVEDHGRAVRVSEDSSAEEAAEDR
jgi:MFS family permease